MSKRHVQPTICFNPRGGMSVHVRLGSVYPLFNPLNAGNQFTPASAFVKPNL